MIKKFIDNACASIGVFLAVKIWGRCVICDIPEDLRTPQICMASGKSLHGAVRCNYELDAFQYVPERLWTPKNCMIAVRRPDFCALAYIPERLKTLKLCMVSVKKAALTIQYVPEIFKTPKICKAAVKENGCALQYVPEDIKTPEICLVVIKGLSAVLFKDFFSLTHEQIEWSYIKIEETYKYLSRVPKEFWTSDNYSAVAKASSDSIKYMSEELRQCGSMHQGYWSTYQGLNP